jgi:hypothetical protein
MTVNPQVRQTARTLSSQQLDRRITQIATSLFNVGFSSHRSGSSLSTSPNALESLPTHPGLLALSELGQHNSLIRCADIRYQIAAPASAVDRSWWI